MADDVLRDEARRVWTIQERSDAISSNAYLFASRACTTCSMMRRADAAMEHAKREKYHTAPLLRTCAMAAQTLLGAKVVS